jgi:recombination protein RecT
MSPEDVTTSATDEDRKNAKKKSDTRLAVREYLLSEESMARFSEILGKRDAMFFVNSVVMAVAFKPELADCSLLSIRKAAMRAATLELSCDESLHQAQLVPYNNKKTGKKDATLIIHYLGLVNLAQRTGKYRTINYGSVTENMTINENTLTGLHEITGRPDGASPILGYFAYYEMINGYRKSEYMTLAEIHAHASQFAPSYKSEYSKWKDPKIRPYLEQKTVIRKLMKSADLSGKAGAVLAAALNEDIPPEEEDGIIDAVAKDVPEEQDPSEPEAPEEPQDVELERPLTPTNLRTWLHMKEKNIGIHVSPPKEAGFMTAMMEYVFAPAQDSTAKRHACLKFLWGFDSSKKMSHPSIKATLEWLNPTQDSGGEWKPDPIAQKELLAVLETVLPASKIELPGMEKK